MRNSQAIGEATIPLVESVKVFPFDRLQFSTVEKVATCRLTAARGVSSAARLMITCQVVANLASSQTQVAFSELCSVEQGVH